MRQVQEHAITFERVDPDDEFAAFVRDEGAHLSRIAWMLVGDAQEAEDLVQEALARTYARWRSAQPQPLAYARRVLVNLRTDRWRRRRNEQDAVQRWQGRAGAVGASDLETDVAAQDEALRLLAALTERQRRVLVLRYLLDLPEDVVAADLKISRGTVKSTAHKALARLRRAHQIHADQDGAGR